MSSAGGSREDVYGTWFGTTFFGVLALVGLIALIVLFFSRPGISNIEYEVRSLRSEVGELKKTIESQTGEIRRLHDRLNQLRPGKAEGKE